MSLPANNADAAAKVEEEAATTTTKSTTTTTTTTTTKTAMKSMTTKEEKDNDNKDNKQHKDKTAFHHALHVQYIATLPSKLNSPDSYEGAVTEHLRMSGIYWAVAALSILESPEEVNEVLQVRKEIGDFVFACWDASRGGFGGNVGHEAHLLYTLSAVQILAMADLLDEDERVDRRAMGRFVASLQQADGSFAGDEWGEVDTRFSYCALSILSILGLLPSPETQAYEEATAGGGGGDSETRREEFFFLSWHDVRRAAQYVASCQNFDGGFGCLPGAESHAGQVFCCVGALAIAQSLDLLGKDAVSTLGWWLAERQCDSGGLNGRPEKQADVCYSWWILSSLSILGKMEWIDQWQLQQFILQAQDEDDGGIADRPHDMPDVFHTFFGLAGLSLLGYLDSPKYRKVDPIYALPTDVVERCGLAGQVVAAAAAATRRPPQRRFEEAALAGGDQVMQEEQEDEDEDDEKERDDRLDRYDKVEL